MENNGWRSLPISKVAKVVRGSSPRPAGSPKYFNGNFLPWITVGDITKDDDMDLSETDSWLTEEGSKYTRILEPETLLLTNSGATLGVPKITLIKAGANDGIAAFLDLDGISKEYLYHFLNSKTQYFREILAPGVGQPNLNTEIIGEVIITIPSLSEQQCIIQVLSAWDKGILKIREILAAKRTLKKALMQQLLTGKRRFKEFVRSSKMQPTRYGLIPQEWSYPKIGEIAEEVSERNTNSEIKTVLSCTKYKGLVDSLKYFGKQIFSEDTSVYKVVRRNQFAYATNHLEEGSIGILDFLDVGLVSPMYTVFKAKECIDVQFLFALLKTELYRHIFEVSTRYPFGCPMSVGS